MTQLDWHDAAPVGSGARIVQLLVLGLVVAVVGVVGLGIVLSEGQVRFTVTADELVVDADPGVFAEQRRVPLSSIQAVELSSAPRGLRTRGTAKPGHCSGWFRREGLGAVWEASTCTQETVVVRLPGETWTLGPEDREGFAAALRSATPGEFAAPPPPAVPTWWRVAQGLIVALMAVPALILAAMLVPIRYAASAGTLFVRSPVGLRRFEVAGAAAARVESPKVSLRVFGMGLPGAWLGIFRVDRKSTHVWATRRAGPAVVVDGPKRVMVTPADPEALLADLREAGAAVPT